MRTLPIVALVFAACGTAPTESLETLEPVRPGRDAGRPLDAAVRTDAGRALDAGAPRDAATSRDAGSRDAGSRDTGSRDVSHPPDADVPACEPVVIDDGHRPGDTCTLDQECPVAGAFGVCEVGWMACVGGSLESCREPPLVPHPADFCGNCLDDDCDGVTDERCPPGCQNYEICANGIDDDCDGIDDDACELCDGAQDECYVWNLPPGEFSPGASESGAWGLCAQSLRCFEQNGDYAAPARDCNTFHCGTLKWPDGHLTPEYCTVIARCVNGEPVPHSFTW